MEQLSINERYLEVLKAHGSWMTVGDWALRVSEVYPEILAAADIQAAGQKNPTTGLKEIAARIGSQISRGAFSGSVEVDTSERPRRVRYLTSDEQELHETQEIIEDAESLTRTQKIRLDYESLSAFEKYRISEIQSILDTFREFLEFDLELDHSKALLNDSEPGKHHPDNIQMLLKSHNRSKSNKNWKRFSVDEQIAYLNALFSLQKIIASRISSDLEEGVFVALIERLRKVY